MESLEKVNNCIYWSDRIHKCRKYISCPFSVGVKDKQLKRHCNFYENGITLNDIRNGNSNI